MRQSVRPVALAASARRAQPGLACRHVSDSTMGCPAAPHRRQGSMDFTVPVRRTAACSELEGRKRVSSPSEATVNSRAEEGFQERVHRIFTQTPPQIQLLFLTNMRLTPDWVRFAM